MRQVVKLRPELEQRLLTVLRKRILPAAQKALRLWKKGDARCWLPYTYTLHSTVQVSTHAPALYKEPGVALLHGACPRFARCRQGQTCLAHPGQGLVVAALGGAEMTAVVLRSKASLHILPGGEDRLRALRHVCSALPRAAQALDDQVRQLSCDQAERCSIAGMVAGRVHSAA